ncbi:MAG: hypothetical protein IPL73_29900 [Candidatus Obscuribacter sp.]|nr:hypothetical protein [Candidatus Obscuribacter sp.]
MGTEIFNLLELAALFTPFVAIALSLLFKHDWKFKILLSGQMAAFVFAITGLALVASQKLAQPVSQGQWLFGVQLDLVTSCLIATITFIAAVVTVFSERYLGGDTTRLSFIYGLCGLSLASSLLVATDNLVVAFALWHLLSWGLFGIVRLRSDVAARAAARTVLAHHLLSDLALALAIVVIFRATGALSFSTLPDNLAPLNKSISMFGITTALTPGSLASLLLVLSFSIKSALFPFHRWLLATLEAPTPLSGFLHAGVVNVSAVLAWRTMPLLQDAPLVLLGWGILSALSAIVGTLSMSAQPDVKRKLVYSTVGQMGFMCLQCASGAIGAAIFHLIAHGMFKCHMFLQSGSAVAEGLSRRKYNYASSEPQKEYKKTRLFVFATGLVSALAIFVLCVNSGWTALCAIITAAAILSAVPAFSRISAQSLSLFWVLTLLTVSFAASVSNQFEGLVHFAPATAVLLPVCLGVFAIIAVVLNLGRKSSLAKALYVHSLNGFYAEDIVQAASSRSHVAKNVL